MATRENNTLVCEIKNKESLHKAYMPFVKNGALFVSTGTHLSLGEEVNVYLTLPETPNPINFLGKVVWRNPKSDKANSGRPAGVGVQFPEGSLGEKLRKTIEGLLGETPPSDPTHTI